MNEPAPVDVNRLKSILNNAKSIMNKVDSGSYSEGHIDESLLRQNGENLVENPGGTYTSNRQNNQQVEQQQQQQVNYSQQPKITEEQIRNSKLPESVKNAYLNNPIPQLNSLNPTFTLEDVQDIVPQRNRRLNENIQDKNTGMNINEDRIRELIKEVLIDYLSKDYSKNLTENVIKKTINTLIKEGKIRTKK